MQAKNGNSQKGDPLNALEETGLFGKQISKRRDYLNAGEKHHSWVCSKLSILLHFHRKSVTKWNKKMHCGEIIRLWFLLFQWLINDSKVFKPQLNTFEWLIMTHWFTFNMKTNDTRSMTSNQFLTLCKHKSIQNLIVCSSRCPLNVKL